ncbi:LOW QUALITY PROTEIN: hypothetical protein HID58_084073 [Brassica napus]|uniref:Uncharacterized protein n=1 Tax=Brassica napus TaxID=3708 RepID=A0ABQ7XIM5_BRANA|nr:LOW QUALITY PROTEIN: hypothetical protein HID58_084073 [Brassica napus]
MVMLKTILLIFSRIGTCYSQKRSGEDIWTKLGTNGYVEGNEFKEEAKSGYGFAWTGLRLVNQILYVFAFLRRKLITIPFSLVEINIHQFFDGYLKGRMHCNGWPEMLKLKDWPPSSSFEERLPTKSGILNLTARLRERFKLNRGDSVTKLHWDTTDSVRAHILLSILCRYVLSD